MFIASVHTSVGRQSVAADVYFETGPMESSPAYHTYLELMSVTDRDLLPGGHDNAEEHIYESAYPPCYRAVTGVSND